MSNPRFRMLENPQIEESYDYAEQVRRQIERCLAASAIEDRDIREGTYEASVRSLYDLVPLEDHDDEFDAELKKCSHIEQQDIRPDAGGTKLSEATCIRLGIPAYRDIVVTDWHQYFQILFNKFVELKVTVRRGSYGV